MKCDCLLQNPCFSRAKPSAIRCTVIGNGGKNSKLQNSNCPNWVFGRSCMKTMIVSWEKHEKNTVRYKIPMPIRTVASSQPFFYSTSGGFRTMEGQTDAHPNNNVVKLNNFPVVNRGAIYYHLVDVARR